ncbi:MAG TPA: class I SAM-dependent methyltransferase [Acidimicrobiales bacterium]|nr:class I SAM-dependent methyltransferase [Acidimicrobiales bacterium]
MRERRLVFGEDAVGYDDARPSYPAALVDDLVGSVGASARVIDVGTGTAKATRLLAERGMTGVGVEADPAMAALAARHLAPYPGWRVDVSDFEWWRPADGDAPADLITAAQAWHWVQPEVGLWRAHRLLRPGGRIAVFWNLADGDDRPVRREIDAVYDEIAPGEPFCPTIGREQGTPFARAPEGATFADAEHRVFAWTLRYARDELLALLRTHSNHKLMAPDQLDRVLAGVAQVVDRHGGTFDYPYVTQLWTARRD